MYFLGGSTVLDGVLAVGESKVKDKILYVQKFTN